MSVRDEEDNIEASRAPLMDHLIELRRRLIWSILAIAAAFVVCFYFAKQIYKDNLRSKEADHTGGE